MKSYDLNLIQKYIDDGLLEVQKHPTLPLKIYNYSREVSFEKKWDEITLAMRGTILDDTGTLITKGYDKFFNYEELQLSDIPTDSGYITVQDKADGSLGILFNYANEWILATRGSFTSDQAIKGMEILKSKYDLSKFDKSITYLSEIIYPENQIVVNYDGEEKLVFTSCVRTLNGKEFDWEESLKILFESGINSEDVVPYTNVSSGDIAAFANELKSKNLNNKEGYVLRFYPSNFRMKIKFEDYCRLHRLMTNFSNVDIWECLMKGDDITGYLDNVPDEFDDWVRNTIKELQFKFDILKDEYEKEFWTLFDKKEFAMKIESNPNKHILFKRLNSVSKVYDEMIWKKIRPVYQKPFWQTKTNLEVE